MAFNRDNDRVGEAENVKKKFSRRHAWRTGISIVAYDLLAFGAPIGYGLTHGDNTEEKFIGGVLGSCVGLVATLIGNPLIQKINAIASNRFYKDYSQRAEFKYRGQIASEKLEDYVSPD